MTAVLTLLYVNGGWLPPEVGGDTVTLHSGNSGGKPHVPVNLGQKLVRSWLWCRVVTERGGGSCPVNLNECNII